MSRKVDPRSMRMGVTKNWKSVWFAEGDEYANRAIEDEKIRKYLFKALRNAGLGDVLIERSIKAAKITIQVAKPGIVIGRKGSGLTELREHLKKITKSELDIQIEEVKKPESNSSIIAESIAMQIERRISAKRAMNMAADKAMEVGAKGIRIEAAGTVFGPNSIAVGLLTTRGAVPTQTLRADINFSKTTAHTRGGTIGIKVWVYLGEIVN